MTTYEKDGDKMENSAVFRSNTYALTIVFQDTSSNFTHSHTQNTQHNLNKTSPANLLQVGWGGDKSKPDTRGRC